MLEIQKAKSKMMDKMSLHPLKSEYVNNSQKGNDYCGGRTCPEIEQVGNCPTAPIV